MDIYSKLNVAYLLLELSDLCYHKWLKAPCRNSILRMTYCLDRVVSVDLHVYVWTRCDTVYCAFQVFQLFRYFGDFIVKQFWGNDMKLRQGYWHFFSATTVKVSAKSNKYYLYLVSITYPYPLILNLLRPAHSLPVTWAAWADEWSTIT